MSKKVKHFLLLNQGGGRTMDTLIKSLSGISENVKNCRKMPMLSRGKATPIRRRATLEQRQND